MPRCKKAKSGFCRCCRDIYALSVNLRSGVRTGALSILHTRFEVEPLLKELNAKQVTVFCSSGGVQRRQQPQRLVVPRQPDQRTWAQRVRGNPMYPRMRLPLTLSAIGDEIRSCWLV